MKENTMGDIILKTTDLTKKYNNKVVVDNLNIEIPTRVASSNEINWKFIAIILK